MPVADLTLNQVVEILRETGLKAGPSSVTRMSGGSISGAHLVTFADGSAPVVLKVFPDDDENRFDKESFIYGLLREHGVTAIPTLLGGAPAESSPLGRPYLVMSKLAGTAAEYVTPTATEPQVAAIYRQMGAILKQVHGIRQAAFGYLTTELFEAEPTNEAFMRTLFINRAATFLEATGDRETHDAAHKYVADRAELLALCTTPVLLHNDFHEGNVLVDMTDDGPVVTGFVDVETAMAGDPVADFAKLDSYSIRGDQVRLRALFEGYGSTPDQWEARQKLYQLIHGFELWVWFHITDDRRGRAQVLADLRAVIAAG